MAPQSNNPASTNTPDWLQNLLSPGSEGLISAPLSILGAYESSRGAPIGSVLQILGNLGLQNAGNRQALQVGSRNVQEMLSAGAAQGLLPSGPNMTPEDKQFYQAVDNMGEPEAAKMIDERMAAEREKQKPYNREMKVTKDGRHYAYDPRTNAITFRPELDDKNRERDDYLKLTEQARWLYDHPHSTEEDAKRWEDNRARALHTQELTDSARLSINTADQKLKDSINIKLSASMKGPAEALPAYRNKWFFDKTTMQRVTNVTGEQAMNPHSNLIAFDPTTARTFMPKIANVTQNIIQATQAAARLAPKADQGVLIDSLNSLFGRGVGKLAPITQNVDAITVRNSGVEIGASLISLYSGSNRMNVAEFNAITGLSAHGSHQGWMGPEDIGAAITYQVGDSREVIQQKAQAMARFRDTLLNMNGFTPATGLAETTQNIIDSTPAPAGIFEELGGGSGSASTGPGAPAAPGSTF